MEIIVCCLKISLPRYQIYLFPWYLNAIMQTRNCIYLENRWLFLYRLNVSNSFIISLFRKKWFMWIGGENEATNECLVEVEARVCMTNDRVKITKDHHHRRTTKHSNDKKILCNFRIILLLFFCIPVSFATNTHTRRDHLWTLQNG